MKLWEHPLDFFGMIWWYVPELLDRYIDFISLVHQLSRRGNLNERHGKLRWVDSKMPWNFREKLSWVCACSFFSFLSNLKKAEPQIVFYLYLPEAVLCGWPEKVSCSWFRVPYMYISIQRLLRHLLSHSMVHLEYRLELLVHHIPCASNHISLSLVTWWTNIAGTLTTWPLPSTSINLSIWWTDSIEVDTRFSNETASSVRLRKWC